MTIAVPEILGVADPDPDVRVGPVKSTALRLFTDQSPATKPYRMWVTPEGTTLGAAESVTRVIETFLNDISTVVIDGFSERKMSFTVWIEGDDPRDLARAEADLMAELYQPNLLWYRGPDREQPWSVFEVSTSELKPLDLGQYDHEEAQYVRGYTIELMCGAWARWEHEEIASTPAGSDAEVIVNDGDLAGVTLIEGANVEGLIDTGLELSFSMIGFWVEAEAFVVYSAVDLDAAVTPMLVVDIGSGWGNANVTMRAYGRIGAGPWVEFTLTATISTDPDAYSLFFEMPTAVYTDVRIQFWFENLAVYDPFNVGGLTVRAIDQTASLGTLRRKLLSLNILGSVPARGSLEITSEDPVGHSLIYSYVDRSNRYVPAISGYYDAALSTDTDAASSETASGRVHQSTGPSGDLGVYIIPVIDLPDGTYDIVIRSSSNTANTATGQVDIAVWYGNDNLYQLDPTPFVAPARTNPLDNNFTYQVIGQFTMPLLRYDTAGSGALAVVVTVSCNQSSRAINWDDLYLCNGDIGELTIYEAAGITSDVVSAAKPNRLSLQSATFDWPAPSLMVGDNAFPGSMHSPLGTGLVAWGRHQLTPGTNKVLTVTNAVDATTEARYYPRSHTYPER